MVDIKKIKNILINKGIGMSIFQTLTSISNILNRKIIKIELT